MKTKLVSITLVVLLIAVITTGIIFFYQNEKESDSLNKLTMQSIQTEETGRKMFSETEGEVYYDVIVPDFTEIYCEIIHKAKSKDDVFNLVEKSLKQGKYSTATHKMTAKLTVENDKETIYLDEAKNKLLENVLIEAVNKAMEVK